MATITVKDKQFSLFIPASEIQESIKKVADKINLEFNNEKPLFIVILNGAFMFAADLFKHIKLDCEISFAKLASYEGTKSTSKVKKLIGLAENINGRKVIIIEDIIDTGITIDNIIQEIKQQNPKQIKICTLFFKPQALQKKVEIDYIGMEIPNDFIVGYGLDYDGQGRNLPDIYKLAE